jgi:hypothetical protein
MVPRYGLHALLYDFQGERQKGRTAKKVLLMRFKPNRHFFALAKKWLALVRLVRYSAFFSTATYGRFRYFSPLSIP